MEIRYPEPSDFIPPPSPNWEGLRMALLTDPAYKLLSESSEPLWTLRLEQLALVESDFWPGFVQNWNAMLSSSSHKMNQQDIERFNGILLTNYFPLEVIEDGSLVISK